MLSSLISDLPTHLRERTRIHHADGEPEGEFILYWMRTAVRSEENPALDVAVLLSEKFQKPLLVYQAISQSYGYASDRHHQFMLEGARDVQAQLDSLDISYAFYLERGKNSAKHLCDLGSQAAIVITEEMPVDPPRRFLRRLVEMTSATTFCIDTACVVPMQLVEKAYTRAFEYRNATKSLYAERVARGLPSVDVKPLPFDLSQLPFEPIDLQAANIPELVSQCDIDHSIPPVIDTVGGSTAGYDRWHRFKESGLSQYAKRRNNALADGVSRMSAYLHYGMVSPLKLAREAAEIGNEGSEKYLDELLIWRELAYAFCFYREDHDQWSALPEWAQKTLVAHADDRRESRYTLEQLSRGETADEFWNAAQKSLVLHGELHNNVRMTWGKAIIHWIESPQAALQTIIELNNRFALDGRDPSSYGGILWCLGQFDRPFRPEQPVIGTVRPRPTEEHAKRLNTKQYTQMIHTPRHQPLKIAVIGAGISGLAVARTLTDHGHSITVFEKSRGVGGRMSTRRCDDGLTFDHGAQYFTARDERFKRCVDSWIDEGVVSAWPNSENDSSHQVAVIRDGKIQSYSESVARYVGNPTMNAVCKKLAEGIEIQKATRVGTVTSSDDSIKLLDEEGKDLGSFDQVVVTAPAEQSADLLKTFNDLHRQIEDIEMNPCWAVMAAFEERITSDWAGAFIHGSFLSWASRNSTKPGRNSETECIVIHAGPKWTQANWEKPPGDVASEVLEEFWNATQLTRQQPTLLQAHRWRYAIPINKEPSGCLIDSSQRVVVCGDWLAGGRVEGAYLNGIAAAGRLLGTLKTE